MADMYIDWQPLSDFSGRLESSYSVSGSALTTAYIKGKNASSFLLTSCEIGLRTITLPIVFFGVGYTAVMNSKNRFDAAAVAKKVELRLPDGYDYTSILTNAGAVTWIGSTAASCTYTFQGVQHSKKMCVMTTTGKVWCESTAPKVDCSLRTTVTADAEVYYLAGAKFQNVHAGDVLELDGINKRILINNAPAANRCEFLRFPFLKPGANVLAITDPVKVTYYPTYI